MNRVAIYFSVSLILLFASGCVVGSTRGSKPSTLVIEIPSGWRRDPGVTEVSPPSSIDPIQQLPEELTTVIAFHRVDAFPNQDSSLQVKADKIKEREALTLPHGSIYLTVYKNDMCTYYVTQFEFKKTQIYTTLVLSTRSKDVAEYRKKEFFEIVDKMLAER